MSPEEKKVKSQLDELRAVSNNPLHSRESLRVNIPKDWKRDDLRHYLEYHFPGQINFVSVPMKLEEGKWKNLGFGFFNMTNSGYARLARKKLKGEFWQSRQGPRQHLQPCWAKVQNIQEYIEQFQKDPIMYQQDRKPWFSADVEERLRESASRLTEQMKKANFQRLRGQKSNRAGKL